MDHISLLVSYVLWIPLFIDHRLPHAGPTSSDFIVYLRPTSQHLVISSQSFIHADAMTGVRVAWIGLGNIGRVSLPTIL